MIDGIWWLVILLVIIIALWLIARSRSSNADGKLLKGSKTMPNDALQKTVDLIKKQFPGYRAVRRESHLMVTKKGQKIAMITIDKGMVVGRRLLGDVPILNYHGTPSRAQLQNSLEEIK